MIKRYKDHISFGILLSLILPGAGHSYWREHLFGIFVFLVMVVASILFFFSFLTELPFTVKLLLFALPSLFYVFSFVDLWRTIHRKRQSSYRSSRRAWSYLVAGIIVCLVFPLSPANFLLRNKPIIARSEIDGSGPKVVLIDRAAYRVNLFFLPEPYPHKSPARWDLVQFYDWNQAVRVGFVMGGPGEEVTYTEDTLFVDGFPVAVPATVPIAPGNKVPLTQVDPDGILIATLDRGAIEETLQVTPRAVIGKVHRLF